MAATHATGDPGLGLIASQGTGPGTSRVRCEARGGTLMLRTGNQVSHPERWPVAGGRRPVPSNSPACRAKTRRM